MKIKNLSIVLMTTLLPFYGQAFDTSGKVLLTGGVSQIEGSAGGGLTPWAVIGGYGTEDQIGFNAFQTKVNTTDYTLDTGGVMIGLYDRIELSYAKQNFNTQSVGAALGVGFNFRFIQNIYGLKVRLTGDALLDQDSWIPQIAVGVQYKQNEQGDVVRLLGAKDISGYDYYLSATKIYLNQSLLANLTLRSTKANQLGLLGYGGDKNDNPQLRVEGSLAYLLNQNFAIGLEYRQKPNNLGVADENDWSDLFLAWAPTKNISVTVASAKLGNIAIKDNQNGLYSSIQIGF